MVESDDQILSYLSGHVSAIPRSEIQDLLRELEAAQVPFAEPFQKAVLIRLLHQWRTDANSKIVTSTSMECQADSQTCVHFFGILSRDWPGLSNACLGVIHETGWNVDFVKAFNMACKDETLGIVLIGIQTHSEAERKALADSSLVIFAKLQQAAVGSRAKAALLSEDIRKLEIYGQIVATIEERYPDADLEQILSMNGEAVKFFAARSRDYIENRKVEDIAAQIVRNYGVIKAVRETPDAIQLDISNLETRTEGTFTTVTVAGPASMLNLEDCLKTLDHTVPGFLLKHNREFTTNEGVSLYRIEFVDSVGSPLTASGHEKLRQAFANLVLTKRQNRAQWIEAIGGFEHYARAIIPLLVKEANSTQRTQVYQSAGQTTDLFIDFKIIVVIPNPTEPRKRLVTKTVHSIESVPGLDIFGVKPPITHEGAEVFIIDLRANLAVFENAETIFRAIKDNVRTALGEFRDFDEGMRTLDTEKFKSVRRMIDGVDKSLLRELYYSIEDFFRVSASIDEIVAHIQIALEMLHRVEKGERRVHVLTRETGVRTADGATLPRASLLCAAVPQPLNLLQRILESLEHVDVTVSRLERPAWNILVCRLTAHDHALPAGELNALAQKILHLGDAAVPPTDPAPSLPPGDSEPPV
jgi:hypothetical protein